MLLIYDPVSLPLLGATSYLSVFFIFIDAAGHINLYFLLCYQFPRVYIEKYPHNRLK